MSRGIQITKDGSDLTNTKSEDLYVDSTTPLFKLAKSGSGKQEMIGTLNETYDIVIRHDLGYKPFFLVYADTLPGGARTYCSGDVNTNSQFNAGLASRISNVTDTAITLTMGVGGTPIAGVYGYSYFIYYDRII